MIHFCHLFPGCTLTEFEEAVLSTDEPDIGAYDVDQLRASRDSVKTKLLFHRFMPAKGWEAPLHQSGGVPEKVS